MVKLLKHRSLLTLARQFKHGLLRSIVTHLGIVRPDSSVGSSFNRIWSGRKCVRERIIEYRRRIWPSGGYRHCAVRRVGKLNLAMYSDRSGRRTHRKEAFEACNYAWSVCETWNRSGRRRFSIATKYSLNDKSVFTFSVKENKSSMRLLGNDYNKMEFAGPWRPGDADPFVVGYITLNKMDPWYSCCLRVFKSLLDFISGPVRFNHEGNRGMAIAHPEAITHGWFGVWNLYGLFGSHGNDRRITDWEDHYEPLSGDHARAWFKLCCRGIEHDARRPLIAVGGWFLLSCCSIASDFCHVVPSGIWVVMAFIQKPELFRSLRSLCSFRFPELTFARMTGKNFSLGLSFRTAQAPLTLGNAVIGRCGKQWILPDRKVKAKTICIDHGVMNSSVYS